MDNELTTLRQKIDEIDSEMIRLFTERMAVAEKIGEYKKKNSLPVLDSSRENEKLTKIVSVCDDTLKPYLRDLYKEIFSLSRQYQKNGVVCRLAEHSDMPALRLVVPKIVARMDEVGVPIWNDVYPIEVLPVDIDARRLYLLTKDGDIVALFALLEPFHDTAKSTVVWEEDTAPAMYLYRLCVNPDYAGQGYASLAVEYIKAITRARGYKYVRLYVVDTNKPAVRLYERTGFRKADGVRVDDVSTDTVLIESGFEAKV